MDFRDNEDYCLECESEVCECTPKVPDPSPFDEAIDGLVQQFGSISKESMRAIANEAAGRIANEIRNSVKDNLKKAIQSACGDEIRVIAKQHMREVFAVVVEEKVVQSVETWTEKTATIKEIIHKEMTSAIASIKAEHVRKEWIKEAIDSFVSKDLRKVAESAVAEFKAELGTEAKREATKALTATLAKAVASDTRLTSLIQALEYNGKN